MALNIKNAEVERLAAELARLTGETKTEAIRRALIERRADAYARRPGHSHPKRAQLHSMTTLFSRIVRHAGGMVVLALAASCGEGARELTVAGDVDSRGFHTIVLSLTPTEAITVADPVIVASDLTVGSGPGVEFGAVADVTSLREGRFAVADMLENEIVVLDSSGGVLARHGGEGDAPGEFRAILALTESDGRIIIWQDRPNLAFTVMSSNGSAAATASQQVKGDWGRASFRWPPINHLGPGFQTGPEDVTRRLGGWSNGGFIHLLQENEQAVTDFQSPTVLHDRHAWLMLYDSTGGLKDTLATMSAPSLFPVRVVPGYAVTYEEAIFGGRPLWAAGDGWIAVSHTDSAAVEVTSGSGRLVSVRWPVRRRPLEDSDRMTAMRWILAHRLLNCTECFKMYEADSRRERLAGMRAEAATYRYSDNAPMIASLEAAGRCLFISGHDPDDSFGGASLAMLVIDVIEPAFRGVIRLKRPDESIEPGLRGAVLHSIDPRFAFAVSRNRDGLHLVHRYALPDLGCDA